MASSWEANHSAETAIRKAGDKQFFCEKNSAAGRHCSEWRFEAVTRQWQPRPKAKSHLQGGFTISSLGSRFSYPISQMDKLFYFPPLITAFVGFVRTVTDLPEWMLGVADYIYNHLQRFCHIPMFLSLTRQSVKDANLWEDSERRHF